MFLSSFRQNANAKIANNTCYQDTIVIQIAKKLQVTEKKKLITFLKSAPKICQEQLKNCKKHEKKNFCRLV